ncbi:hypothetical protein EGW08_019631 [Elysia chlorotica]|uniref:SMB domain-containing protein n=1 Tax=Elysia chlorotica TaxID=188477 RepID=A0A3S0ZDN9_ELYCH|nr:hypothetical protein EGW08_019631 [Elysia chlorotica]
MRSSSVIICVALLVAVMVHASSAFKDVDRKPNPRSCREANMCCQGQNNTCFVFGRRVDRSTDSKRCYCDSNCLIMGDCCMDYHHHCKIPLSQYVESSLYIALFAPPDYHMLAKF